MFLISIHEKHLYNIPFVIYILKSTSNIILEYFDLLLQSGSTVQIVDTRYYLRNIFISLILKATSIQV